MRNVFLLSILIFGSFSYCTSNSNQRKADLNKRETIISEISTGLINLNDLLVNRLVDTSETFFIEEECVYVIQMTMEESDSIENSNPDSYEIMSEQLNNIALDNSELLDRLEIKNHWSDKRYVFFKNEIKDYLIDTRKEILAGNYCVFFKMNKVPELVKTEALTEKVLNEYFKK